MKSKKEEEAMILYYLRSGNLAIEQVEINKCSSSIS